MVEGSDGGTPNLWKIGFHQETTKMQEQNPHKSSRAFTNLINFRNSSLGHQQLGNGDWPLVRLRKPPDPLSLSILGEGAAGTPGAVPSTWP